MDYRSLFRHFENAVLLYNVDMINDISNDFEQLFKVSRLVNEIEPTKKKIGRRILGAVLRLIAPLI